LTRNTVSPLPFRLLRRQNLGQLRPEYKALNAARARMHDAAWNERYRIVSHHVV